MILQPRPELGAPSTWLFPEFTTRILANGLQVSTSHLPGKPVAAVKVLLPTTTGHDPVGKEGLASLTAALLDEGTAEKDAETFADHLELLGASWKADASSSGLTAGIEVPVQNLGKGLRLVAEAITSPAVPAKEYGMVVNQISNIMKGQQANPSARAQLAHLTSIWDPAARAAVPGNGTPESLGRIERSDVTGLVQQFSPRGAHLYIAGDLGGLDVDRLVEEAFGAWKTESNVTGQPGEDRAGSRRLIVVDRPGSVQTQLVLGSVAPTRSSRHWSALQVGTHILGGTLTSRIDMLLREEKGYTYGMRASLAPRPLTGSWQISGSVDTPSTLPAVDDLLNLLDAAQGGVTEAEVQAAAAYLVGVSPLRWESPAGIVSQTAALAGAGLAPQWVNDYLYGMGTATVEEVNAALDLLPLTELSVVAVGDAEKIAAGLAELTGMRAEVVAE